MSIPVDGTFKKINYSWQELKSRELEEVKWAVEPYIPQTGIVLLHGKFGTYKTPLTTMLAVAAATGKSIWGLQVVKTTPVLYLQADTPEQVIVPRLKKLQVTWGLDDDADLEGNLDFIFAYPGVDLVNPLKQEWDKYVYSTLQALYKQKHYKLVFIDSLRTIHNLDDKDSGTASQVYQAVGRLFPDAAIVIVHHDKKSGDPAKESEDSKAEMFSGSQAWINHATVGLHVKHHNKEKKEIELIHNKTQASEKQAPLLLKASEDSATLTSVTDVQINQVEIAINTLLGNVPDATETQKDRFISDWFKVSLSTARRMKGRLQEQGG